MKSRSSALSALVCSLGPGPGFASDTANGQGFYIGLFGGAGTASSMSARREGGFYRPGPLNTRVGVDAQGQTGGEPVGVLGLQAGYEWKPQAFGQTEWALKPAAELEGLYIGQQAPVGDMPITPGALGTQDVTLPMTVGVALANAVLTVQTPWSGRIFPDLGVGARVARLSIQGANSTNPSEPGINHFDSWPDEFATASVRLTITQDGRCLHAVACSATHPTFDDLRSRSFVKNSRGITVQFFNLSIELADSHWRRSSKHTNRIGKECLCHRSIALLSEYLTYPSTSIGAI